MAIFNSLTHRKLVNKMVESIFAKRLGEKVILEMGPIGIMRWKKFFRKTLKLGGCSDGNKINVIFLIIFIMKVL